MDGFAHSLAILIAIDCYENGVPVLRTPVSDAEALADVLRQEHGFETEVWSNEKATLSGMRAILADLHNRVSTDDRVIFYFAGHGIALESEHGPTGFVLPQDAQRNSPDMYMGMVELQEALSALPCRHMLVILDCCFAGAFRWASFRHLAPAAQNLHRERYNWFIHDAAWQAIASAAHDEKALDIAVECPLGKRDGAREHSPFASALIRGLKGAADRTTAGGVGDGVITATELYLYLEDELFPKSHDGFRQTPMFWPLPKHDKGQFIFLVPGQKLALPHAPPLDADANPWRALEVYESRHEDLFFGRADASKVLLAHVLGAGDPKAPDGRAPNRFVVVTGPSGIGKSSLVRAGLLPRLRKVHGANLLTIITRPNRPGPDIFGSLADELKKHSSPGRPAPSAEVLRTDRNSLSRWCKSQSVYQDLIIVVDQAEEIFTGLDPDRTAADFLALIKSFLNDGNARARVIFTVRSEVEPQFSESALQSEWPAARHLVPGMTQDELRRVIEGPAAVKVLRFESAALVDALLNEVISMPGGLPILSFALSQMYLSYLSRRGTDRVITHLDYAALQGGAARSADDDTLLKGGVTAALRVSAEKVLDSLDESSRSTARRVLERFVSVESGQFARRRVPREEIEESPESKRAKRVLELFDEARLIVTDNVDGDAYLELAHDALIFGWTRLLNWVRTDAPRIATLRRFTTDATQWAHTSRQVKDLLWSDAARSITVQDLLSAEFPGLNSIETEFAQASLNLSKRNRRIRKATLAGLSLLTIIAIIAAALYSISVEQTKMDHLLSAARSFEANGDPVRAYAFALATWDEASKWQTLSGSRKIATESVLNSLINRGVPQVYAHFQTTFNVSLSDKGAFIAAIGNAGKGAGRNTLVVGTPDQPTKKVAEGPFMAGAFRPGHDEYYVASSRDKHVVIDAINAVSGETIKHFTIPEFQVPSASVGLGHDSEQIQKLNSGEVDNVMFSADGKILILAGWAALDRNGIISHPWRAYLNVEGGALKQYASPDEKVDLPFAVHIQHIAANRDGSRVASAGLREVYLDGPVSSKRVVVGSFARGNLLDLAISPSGKRIVAGGPSGAITLFQEGPDDNWTSTEFSLPGDADVELLRFISEDVIAASRADYTIDVSWIRLNHQQPALVDRSTLRGHSGKIHNLLVDRVHKRIFSAGEDREVRIWGLETGERRVLRGSERAVMGLVQSGSTDWLVSWDLGGKVLAWHISDGVSPLYTQDIPGKGFEDPIATDSFLGAGDGGSLTAYVSRLDSHLIQHMEIAAGGRLLAVGYYGGTIVIWDRKSTGSQKVEAGTGTFALSEDGEYLTADNKVMKASEKFARVYATTVPAILRGDKWVTIEKGIPSFHTLAETSLLKSQNIENYVGDSEVRRFSSNGKWLVSLAGQRYSFWRSPFQSKARSGRAPTSWNFVMCNPIFGPADDQILTMMSGKNGTRLVQIDLAREQVSIVDSGELAPIFHRSRDGSYVAAAGRFGELYFGRIDSFHLREVGRHSRQILSMAFSADGSWLATGGLDRTVRVWSTSTFESVRYDFLNPVEAMVFDDTNHQWLVSGGGTVFSLPLMEDNSSQATSRMQSLSNSRVDGDTTVLRPVQTTSFP